MKPLLSALPRESAWPAEVRWEEFDCAMVESPAEVRFLGREQIREAIGFPRGVAFGPKAELRWMRRAGGQLHFVYLNDEGRPLREDAPHKSTVTPVEEEIFPQQFFLWNASDGRIPKTPSYPYAGTAERLAVRVRHYKLEWPAPVEHGGMTAGPSSMLPPAETFLFRCISLEPAETGAKQ
ncbi:MAG TPA: hypothetical protein VNW97_02580 [Candidatus Saccharimonadales bacterium]|jgi:hypothetical protein|nr:hypothetical protein [Candidatus Saccharimonadales bacterium]